MGKTQEAATDTKQKGKHRFPEKKIGPFANGIGVCIWLNSAETETGTKQFRSITINPRRYLDKESGEWKDAANFNPSDLPALLFCLSKAQEYCYEHAVPEANGAIATSESSGSTEKEIPF